MKCFVVSPIGQDGSDVRRNSDELLNDLIQPVCDDLSIDVIRADKISGAGRVTDDIFQHLKEDDLVIADITGLNPNVCIELGYRIAIDKVFIILCNKENMESYPFDISNYRIINYSLRHSDFDKAKSDLKSYIQNTNFSQNKIEHHNGFDIVSYDEGFGIITNGSKTGQ
jgi:hypothetical protein